MTTVVILDNDMGKLTKILLLITVIFLAGCEGQGEALVKRESKVKNLLNKHNIQINKNNYTIKRGTKGVYIYIDKPTQTKHEVTRIDIAPIN